MDVIADLFALLAINPVKLPFDIAFDEIAQEAVRFHAAVVWASEAAAPETAGFHSEIAAILLHQDIGGNFRGAE
jgi:hypothetical protein